MEYSTEEKNVDEFLRELGSSYKRMTKSELAAKAVDIVTRQSSTCFDFKKPRVTRLNKYWELYDGKTTKKLRQLFNVAIPVFPGMIDTLNAQYDTPIELTFREGDPADYFKVEKVNAAFRMEVMDASQNSKWDSKLSMGRKHAIMNGRAILKYHAQSDPEYKSELDNVNLKNFIFQPKGGLYLENHLFSGEDDIEKTKYELIEGALGGIYDKEQTRLLIARCEDREYLPQGSQDWADRLSRFKPLGLDPDNHSYVGTSVYKLAQQILEIDGCRYYILYHPWTQTWLRFEKWRDINSSDLYPYVTYATHEDDENFLSKSYADDLYPAADAIVSMFNQELTNREKRNFGPRAYDKDMFPDVRKLDDAMHRPDALVPADTKGGTRQISQGIYEFKVGELGGTVNLIDWVTGNLGRNTGANDLAQGSVQSVSKKASVTFAEQKSVSKRIGWAAQPFQNMMADLGNLYLYGLKDHMPAKMAIRFMGENGYDWEEITRMDLQTTKNIDILIESTDKKIQESEIRKEKRAKALELTANSQNINSKKRDEEILRSIGEYDDEDIAEFLDTKTYSDKKSLAKASEAIQLILRNKKPDLWYGATIAFIQKIVDFANDKRNTLGPKFKILVDYAMAHKDIVRDNIERQVAEEVLPQPMQAPGAGLSPIPAPEAMPPGVSRAMNLSGTE